MKKTEISREHLINITTDLIKEADGDPKKITSRLIAQRADVGLGTINYYFGSKENLITECIQRTINQMLVAFTPDITDTEADGLFDQERLTTWAAQTFDFLFANQAIINISILADMQHYLPECNSVYIQKGFSYAIREATPQQIKQLLIFILVSTMQTAFLARDIAKELLGYDLYIKQERDSLIHDVIAMLFHGKNNEAKAHENR